MMNTLLQVPPGFRFHPTDEELVDYYLRKKISSRRIDLDIIKDVDLYKIEPWDLQEICSVGRDDENEWHFFSHKDKKYPTGSRTNRATSAGFWKATGRDKAIYSKHQHLIGMRKTLVFYKGRAPNGQKSDWIMHEYRLETNENATPQEEGWVVCRVFKKRIATVRRMNEHESSCWYDEPMQFMPDLDSPNQSSHSNFPHHVANFPCKKEYLGDHKYLSYQSTQPQDHNNFLHLPLLETQKLVQSVTNNMHTTMSSLAPYGLDIDINQQASNFQSSTTKQNMQQQQQQQNSDQNVLFLFDNNNSNNNNNDEQIRMDELTDWRVFDKYVASQLSHENASKQQNSPTSTSTCQIQLWKH